MLTPLLKRNYFLLSLIACCVAYLGCEFFYNHYIILSVDEFWFAHRTYQYKNGLPYRDFAPYKTVLGYYLLLAPILFSASGSIFKTLLFTKNVIALMNTLIFFIAGIWLKRLFLGSAILLSMAMLLFSETVLSYSTNIRVDLFSYWFCFISLFLLLEKRYFLAGLLLALGFATSQKALWYIFATNSALAVNWLISANKKEDFWHIIHLNCAILFFIFLYIVCWAWVGGLETVLRSVFYEGYIFYHLDWYDAARKLFWSTITGFNPLLFFLWPITAISIFVTFENDTTYRQRLFIVVYALAILLCLIPYKQVFPYYMQVVVPALMVLYAAFFTWLLQLFHSQPKIYFLTSYGVWIFLIAISATIAYFIFFFALPSIYLLIEIIPLLLALYITNKIDKKKGPLFLPFILITVLLMGFIYPLSAFMHKVSQNNGAYQKAHVEAVNLLLADQSDYLAGIELIYTKDQPIEGMRHLDGWAIDYLYYPIEKLKPALLPSLYATPDVSALSVIEALKKSSVKFYVNNVRMMALPQNIKDFLATQYAHYWGSIYLYAPQVSAGTRKIMLKFSGMYHIESSNQVITLDNHTHTHPMQLYLSKGEHTSQALHPYRLKLLAPELAQQEHAMQTDQWEKILG